LREGYKVRYLVAAGKVGLRVREQSRGYRFPVLALEGEKDAVLGTDRKSKEVLRAYLNGELCDGRAKVISYPDGHHSMIVSPTGDANTDGTTEKLLRDVVEWLDERSGKDGRVARNER
jgi:poly(3-hydroxyalkanoate) synthetase